MTLLRFTGLFTLLGFVIPLVFRLIWWSFDYFKISNLGIHGIVEKLMLMLWPTSLMTLPTSDVSGFEAKLLLISLVANMVVYFVLGGIIWLGLRKHIGFLVLAGLMMSIIWWRLLTL